MTIRIWLLRRRWPFPSGRVERTGAAGTSHQGHLPERLPGAVPELRRQPEPRGVPLRDPCHGSPVGISRAHQTGLAEKTIVFPGRKPYIIRPTGGNEV